jgi:CheY-like chemotaxis protein
MKSKKILIVDDNDLNRKLFENLIAQFYTYESAVNGLEAIDYLTKESFDLILMDIQIPELDGFAVFKKIQQDGLTESPVIAITAYAEESDRNNFLKMGFSHFITKPIRPKEFLEVIRIHLYPTTDHYITSDSAELSHTLLDISVISQLMKYNSKEAIKGVFRDFISDTSILLENAELALNQKNEQKLIENLHILKGNSGTLGANSIYLLAKTTDANIRDRNWIQLKESLEKLKKEKLIFEKYIEEELIFKL